MRDAGTRTDRASAGCSGMREDTSIQTDEDIRLMLRVKKGDRQAYARLYGKYVPLVKRYVARHSGRIESPEDLTQEVFARVWCRRSQYRFGSVKSYLIGVAVNVLRENHGRNSRKSPFAITEADTLVETNHASPLSQAESEDQVQAMWHWADTLSAKQRQVLELVYVAGLSPHEAAQRLGCSTKTVYSHLCSARQALRQLARACKKK